jgi:hypothetical protein
MATNMASLSNYVHSQIKLDFSMEIIHKHNAWMAAPILFPYILGFLKLIKINNKQLTPVKGAVI